MGVDRIAELLRREPDKLVERWEQAVQDPALREVAHELVAAIAAWIEGATDHAERAFAALCDAPALQALGYAGGLEALTRELAMLRAVIAREAGGDAHELAPLHAAIHRAIGA